MNIAIIGATGLVGREALKIICENNLQKNNNIFLYASSKSKNKIIKIRRKSFVVNELNENNLQKKYDFALFCAGGEISRLWAKHFVNRGAIVIDNSSYYRREKNVPLIVPEINLKATNDSKIISNPNCSTIGASLPLFLLGKLYKIKRVIISTYQAVSGAGKKGQDDLKSGTTNKFEYKIKNNLIPQIDRFCGNGYTYEEDKMLFELKKILKNNNLKISATCVRVPILNCHSESIFVEFCQEPNIEEIKKHFKSFKGIQFVDESSNVKHPMPIMANGKDDILVGRLRSDTSCKKAICFFVCFDNLRKGAALNAVQILKALIQNRKSKD